MSNEIPEKIPDDWFINDVVRNIHISAVHQMDKWDKDKWPIVGQNDPMPVIAEGTVWKDEGARKIYVYVRGIWHFVTRECMCDACEKLLTVGE